MVKQERQTIRQLKALLGTAIAIGIAVAFSSAHANDLNCESSHLSTPAPNLGQIAANLAKLRLQIYQMPTTVEKSRANEEFKSKFADFESIVGNKEKAERLFQNQIRLVMEASDIDPSKEAERQEKERKEREKESLDPINLVREMEFHEIRPGKFMMGDDEKVEVEITKPFAMMSTLVTQMMWSAISAANGKSTANKINPSHFKDGPKSSTFILNGIEVQMNPDHPVESATWIEIQEWIKGLNTLSKTDDVSIQSFIKKIIPDHKVGDVYDLPTEAQWEFVMRNRGQEQKKWFDRDDTTELHRFAWIFENADMQTHDVATLEPRLIDGKPFFDLEGNVAEFTKNWHEKKISGGIDPQGPTNGFNRAIRGGAWSSNLDSFRSGHSSNFSPDLRSHTIGFRLVRTRP